MAAGGSKGGSSKRAAAAVAGLQADSVSQALAFFEGRFEMDEHETILRTSHGALQFDELLEFEHVYEKPRNLEPICVWQQLGIAFVLPERRHQVQVQTPSAQAQARVRSQIRFGDLSTRIISKGYAQYSQSCSQALHVFRIASVHEVEVYRVYGNSLQNCGNASHDDVLHFVKAERLD